MSANGAPEAALVSLAALDDGRVLFNTASTTRKVANLEHQDQVAIVVGTQGSISVQIEGSARLTSGPVREALAAEFTAQLPYSRAMAEGYELIEVVPSWVRVYDLTAGPPRLSEWQVDH